MKKENKNKKTNLFKLFGVTAMASIMALGAVGVGCSFLGDKNTADNSIIVQTPTYSQEQLKTDVTNGAVIKLFASEGEYVQTASATSYVKTITAEVNSTREELQEVAWSIAWEDPTRTDECVMYKLTPQGKTVTVECMVAAKNNPAIITCRTVNGNYVATCRVEYVGIPTDVTARFSGAYALKDVYNDTAWGVTYDQIYDDMQNPVSLKVTPSNPLTMDVSQLEKEDHDYKINIECFGEVNVVAPAQAPAFKPVYFAETDKSGSVYLCTPSTLADDSVVYEDKYGEPLVSISEDGSVTFNAPEKFDTRNGGSGVYFRNYVDNKPVYFTLTVQLTEYPEISFQKTFRILDYVDGVTLSGDLYF